MASEAVVEANKRNAALSTGPRSVAGKERSRLNAVKHGLTGAMVVIPGEDAGTYDGLRAAFYTELQPVGVLEESLVEKIAANTWRLRRVPMLEASVFRRGVGSLRVKEAERRFDDARDGIAHVQRAAAATAEKGLTAEGMSAREELGAALAALQADKAGLELCDVLEQDAHVLATLERHEATLERSLFRSLHELERRQALRAGQAVPVPQVADLDVSVDGAIVEVSGA